MLVHSLQANSMVLTGSFYRKVVYAPQKVIGCIKICLPWREEARKSTHPRPVRFQLPLSSRARVYRRMHENVKHRRRFHPIFFPWHFFCLNRKGRGKRETRLGSHAALVSWQEVVKAIYTRTSLQQWLLKSKKWSTPCYLAKDGSSSRPTP